MVTNDATTTDGVEQLPRHGGRLCLDFINTVEPRIGPVSREWLTGYPDLVAWARLGGLIDNAAAAALLRTSAARPSAAQAAFQAAIDLREALFRVFAAIVDHTTPAPADLEILGGAYAAATKHGRLTPRAGGFEWIWTTAGSASTDPLDRPWWPVAASAVELLTHGPLDRIKQCPTDEGCSWLFLDTTKNRSRRWCSMDYCGSHIKARRQTDRRRASRQQTRA